MRFIASLILPVFLLIGGCSSFSDQTIPVETFITGQTAGDATSIYWLEQKQAFPISLKSRVYVGDYGHYDSESTWRAGVLRELRQQGEQFVDDEIQPFSLVLRFDDNGEAVYQRYRVGERVVPLSPSQIKTHQRSIEQSLGVVKALKAERARLIQGKMHNGELVACGSTRARNVAFDQPLPASVAKKIASGSHFIAALGKESATEISLSSCCCLTGPKAVSDTAQVG